MDELRAVNQEEASVMKQLQHLESELGAVDDSISRLGEKLGPLLPPPCPETCSEDCSKEKEQQRSPIMDQVTNMTARVRSLNQRLCNMTQKIEV